jgi:urease accessory protein
VGGDEIEFDIAVAAGASLSVRSVAAQLVYPGPTGEPSRWTTRATLGRDAALRWLPEPVVAVRGADHRAATHIKMDKGASLVWRDVAVLGRHGEASGSLRQRLRVEREGRPLVCTEVMLGPASPHAAGPAGTGGRRVIATLLVIGGGCSVATTLPTALGVRVGVCELADDAFLLTALSDSVERVMPVLAATAR